MRRTAVVVLAVLLALGGAACSSGKSYDDTVRDCVTALKARADGDKDKPEACEDVKDEDYTALLMSQVMGDNGWVDKDGNVDVDKLLHDSTSQP